MDFDNDNDIKYLHLRLYSLIGLLLVCLTAFSVALFNTQIVHGEDYLQESVRTITLRETVEASRGNLTDRNGQILVSNRSSYTLTFDPSLLPKDADENAAILRLLELCRNQGVVWEDTLPISAADPYVYTLDGLGDVSRSRFLTFLQKGTGKTALVNQDLTLENFTAAYLTGIGLTPQVLLERLRTLFEIPDTYSDADARLVVGVQYEMALRKVVNTNAYILADDIDTKFISLLSDGDYGGARVGSSSVREYRTNYAAHVLGTVGTIYAEEYPALKEQGYKLDDWIGKSGAESAFESHLRGTDGTRVVTTTADGKVTSELYTKEPQPGNNVALTIDLDFQKAVEDILGTTVSEMTKKDGIPRGAGVAVIQVGSGEVLSLASYPTYDLSTYSENAVALNTDPAAPLYNRATSGLYAPGSTFKPLTAVAALESGVITTSTKIRDPGRYTFYAPTYQPKCWIYPGNHGLINVTEAIKVSCNCFFYEVGRRMGIDTLDKYATAFGLGQHTGIEIGDKAGVLAGPAYSASVDQPWYGGNTIQAAIGQSDNLFTPLQLANYIATLVGGGEHYSAHLLKSLKSYDNSQVLYAGEVSPQNVVDIAPSTLDAVKEGMHQLTTSGSIASYFRNCVVDAGAKTGTAQITNQKTNNGVFVCFAPYDDPEIALAIVIEKGGSGSALASTAVTILNAYFTAEEVGSVLLGEGQLLP